MDEEWKIQYRDPNEERRKAWDIYFCHAFDLEGVEIEEAAVIANEMLRVRDKRWPSK